jgi:lipopolysaccharide/colanic/teichoic acid biosynthesis glycosyltransferase
MAETGTQSAIRRTIDIAASAAGLVVLSPVLAVIAIGIRRDSPGPVIFRQTRVGRYGRTFTLYKFRTMYVDNRGTAVTARGDSRITPIGKRLRATKLDELPQLANVLLGDMSLVGPRPEVPIFASRWPEDDRRVILTVRPGITDPVTYELRNEEGLLAAAPDPEIYYERVLLPKKAREYAEYVSNRTLLQDLGTVMKTLRVVAEPSR